jgi:uncharacterized membrane protein HdeD (DUF308 family)
MFNVIDLIPKLTVIGGILALVFGIVIMIFPKILNYLVGIFLILCGVAALVLHFIA